MPDPLAWAAEKIKAQAETIERLRSNAESSQHAYDAGRARGQDDIERSDRIMLRALHILLCKAHASGGLWREEWHDVMDKLEKQCG